MGLKSEVEFCVDGSCRIDDSEKKVYWVDGMRKRLNFSESKDLRDYSQLKEFDVFPLSDEELEIRTLDVAIAHCA